MAIRDSWSLRMDPGNPGNPGNGMFLVQHMHSNFNCDVICSYIQAVSLVI